MTYEIVLTDCCTRSCKFCWVKPTNFVASFAEIQKFITEVKSRQSKKHEKYVVSIFGGEPLLNPLGIQQIVNAFSDDDFAWLSICTNGDLLDAFVDSNKDIAEKLHWAITAHDFFKQKGRYFSLAHKLNDVVLMHTFTEDDIDLADEFIDQCIGERARFKIALSHSAQSWSQLSCQAIYEIAFKLTQKQLYAMIKHFPEFYPVGVSKCIKSLLSALCNASKGARNCLNAHEKLAFYKGEFVGSCMLFANHEKTCLDSQATPNRCLDCQYVQICGKSCIAQREEDGNVPEKLCMIEKAMLDAAGEFAVEHQDNTIWKEILNRMIEEERQEHA